ncbi:MAG: hypothetical protein ACREBS_11450 [Nitrososphaerales archaeon]
MNQKNSAKLAYEIDASRESFEKVVEIMSREVSIPTSMRHNATLDEMDLHRSLIHLAVSNGYAESGMASLVTKGEPLIPPEKVPSGSWIRDTVEKVPEEAMAAKLKNALDSTVRQLKEGFKIFSVPIIGGADTHKIPRYDKNLDRGFLTRSKPERGTLTFEEYMTLQSVEEGRRVQIACEQAHRYIRREICGAREAHFRVKAPRHRHRPSALGQGLLQLQDNKHAEENRPDIPHARDKERWNKAGNNGVH